MNEDNSKKLYADFPRLYREAIAKERMSYGFECSDGWFNLLYKLSTDIEAEAKKIGLHPNSAEWPLALQVKEKFGTLKFYLRMEKGDNELKPENAGPILSFRPMPDIKSIRELIQMAENSSAKICEQCGQPGTLYRGGYWHVACDACEAKFRDQQ
jgi:hypothetical protein